MSTPFVFDQQPSSSSSIAENPLVKLATRLAGIALENAIVKLPSSAMLNARCVLQASSDLPKLNGYALNSTKNVWSKIIEDQGILSIFRGYPIDVMKSFVQFFLNPIAFSLQRAIVPRFNPKQDYLKFYLSSIGGGYLTSIFIQACLRPLEYCRVKLAMDTVGKREYSGAIDVIKKTIKGPNGVMGIYTGFPVALLKTLAYRISYFALYDTVRAVNPYLYERDVFGLLSRFLTAQFVSWASLALCYPLEVVERKMQSQADKNKDQCAYKDSWDCFRQTYKQEGIRGFYRGLENNLTTNIVIGISLAVSDMLLR